MRDIQNKIRNGIANSYHLRSLAKDDRLTPEERNRVFEIIEQNNKKIIYYKMMSRILKEQKNENHTKRL